MGCVCPIFPCAVIFRGRPKLVDSGRFASDFGQQIAFLVKPVLDHTHLCRRNRPEKPKRFVRRPVQPVFPAFRLQDHRHPPRRVDRCNQVIRFGRDHRMSKAAFFWPAQIRVFLAPKAGDRKGWPVVGILRLQPEPVVFSRVSAFGFANARCRH